MDIARAINIQAGGPVIAAWEVDQLPEEWIDTILAVSRGLPEMMEGINKIKKVKADIIATHSTYKPIPKRQ